MTSIVPSTTRARPLGANDAIRVAVAGLGCRGPVLVRGFHRLPGVRIVALCDADRLHLDREAKAFADRNEPVDTQVDVRRLIDDRNVDALVVATPDHWHALMTVWSCQAGKDVYVEKPVSYCLREGRAMVEAARKHGRIVQAGTQNRSDKGLKAACDFLREGHLGKILLARGQDYPLEHWSIGRVDKPQPVPETVDYNLFQGPAPLLPVMRKQFHYDWHFFWPMGTGDCGNRGVHTFDHIRWLIGAAGLPERVVSVGGRFGFDDNGETPNTQIAWFEYKPVPILWEMKTLPARKGTKERESWKGIRASMVLECEGGRLQGGRGGATAFDRDGKRIRHFKGDSGVTHMANFIAAVRSRDARGLAAEILEGHHSSALCHLANISHRTGMPQPPDAIAKSFRDHPRLADSFERLLGHLKANEIDLARTPLVAGPMLTLDAAAERFTGEGADRANAFLTRTYRAPFILPGTA
jgi:predicted dehydrogenase